MFLGTNDRGRATKYQKTLDGAVVYPVCLICANRQTLTIAGRDWSVTDSQGTTNTTRYHTVTLIKGWWNNMLESNTDRSYFMIGAVIVAGIIIAGLIFIFKDQLFGNDGAVQALVNSLFDSAKGMIDNLDTNTGTTPPPTP